MIIKLLRRIPRWIPGRKRTYTPRVTASVSPPEHVNARCEIASTLNDVLRVQQDFGQQYEQVVRAMLDTAQPPSIAGTYTQTEDLHGNVTNSIRWDD